jgi:hypothetical protein
MPETTTSSAKQLEELQTQVDKLKHQIEEYERTQIPALLQQQAEKILLEGHVFKGLKWLLIGAIILGILVWLGGTIYGGVKLTSLHEAAVQFKAEVASSTSELSTLLKAAQDKQKDVLKQIGALLKPVRDEQDSTLKQINARGKAVADRSSAVLREIQANQDLKDLAGIRRQIQELAQRGGKLRWAATRDFMDATWYVLIGLSALCTVLCFAMWRSARRTP